MVGICLVLAASGPLAAPIFPDELIQPSLVRDRRPAATATFTRASVKGNIDEEPQMASDSSFLDPNAQRILELTNRERLRVGLEPLKLNPMLSEAAAWMASDMAAHNYCDHLDTEGRRVGDRAYDFGYRAWRQIGENIAAGQETPELVVSEWLSSPSHRTNIVRQEFTEIGIGYVDAPGSSHRRYWVETFGVRPAYVVSRWR